MKVFTTLMFIIYFIVYGYACWMTSLEPEKKQWGYICVVVMMIMAIWGISIFAKNQRKNNDEENQ